MTSLVMLPGAIVWAVSQTVTSSAALEQQVATMRIEMAQVRAELEAQREDAARLRPAVDLHVYVDLGAFIPSGDGAGVVLDAGKVITKDRFREFGWVFLGDLFSTMINSRGEAADLGQLPGVSRFDGVRSRGAAGFIVNEVNFSPDFRLGDELELNVSIDFVPRTGQDLDLGDFLDVDLAQLVWFVRDDRRFILAAGKVQSVFGIEYRERKAPRRFGVTPSLAARYDTGTALGIRGKALLFDDWLIVAASLTNGTASVEHFHFYDEVDSNDGKTMAGRVAIRVPLDRLTDDLLDGPLEIGASAQWGPQDRALDESGSFWLVGGDLSFSGVALALKGQLLTGGAPGKAVDGAHRLDLKLTGYLEVDYLVLPWLGVFGRIDFRNAIVSLGTERLYLTEVARATLGLQLPVSGALILKAEYNRNFELGALPDISNDVITSSLVVVH